MYRETVMAEKKLVRVQEKGQITLPVEFRRKFGIEKGDLVAVELCDGGVLVTPQEVIAMRALDEIGAALRERGISLEELMDTGADAVNEHG